MTLDIVETISSTFGRLRSKASLGVAAFALGLILVMFLGITATGAAVMVSTAAAVVIGLITLVAYIAGSASLTIGSLRAFDEKNIEKGMFTENIIWPFLRMTGSNIVLQAFIFATIYLVAYPVILIGMGASGMMASAAGTMPSMGTADYAALGLAGGIAVAAALYVFSALSISLPRIAVNNQRLFESLDESVQITSGKRLRVIGTMIPFAVLLIAAMAALFAIPGLTGFALYIVLAVIGGLYWLALLAELNDRL